MDLQTIADNTIKAARADRMNTSDQLTIGELILKLEALPSLELPVFFDTTKKRPSCIGSWRGIYADLYISYEPGAGDHYNSDVVTHESEEYGNSYEGISTSLSEKPTAKELLIKLKECVGKTFVGYKGGDFVMGKTIPVWISLYGECGGFRTNEDGDYQAVVDVKGLKTKVSIVTELMDC